MSKFTKPVIVQKVGDNTWKLYKELEYHVGSADSQEIIIVPKNFTTDFASVPRLFWTIIPPDGRWTAAAILHDYLYSRMIIYPRKRCDEIFLEAMEVLGVPLWKRYIMYGAVRMFGGFAWRAKARKLSKILKQGEENK